ncbi:hypothetical protein OOT46_18660 [Aquabacterium sp. A7-Y]|uniref:hypothetical protein n=1 Tax=Aquabacterium sp. A7-Y TaxID=1349605 RepID=UPI00223E12D5|nr:hypothetical protein [Aquabacterium sp. A7-Y]MCW7539860.1 hypothetical protein [Aquabacterium sp. A7-Y]
MALKRMVKEDMPLSFGAFNPVGHIVIGFDSDERASEAAQALREAGFDAEDIVQYSCEEGAREMEQRLARAGGAAEFGHEIRLMRRYKQLADEGCGWLVVFAPDATHAQRVSDVALRFQARIAERYGRLVIEDLI